MRAERVVELVFGNLSAGSGYLITSRHVLTARHVVEPAQIGARCKVQSLAAPGFAAIPLTKAARPKAVDGSAKWISKTRDIAIVELDQDLGLSEPPLTLGLIPRGELRSYDCSGIGFPAASGDKSHQFSTTLTWRIEDKRFKLDVIGSQPKDWEQWAGLSGCVIFCRGFPVGVIQTVDAKWDSILWASPLELLIEDPDFETYWTTTGLPKLDFRHVSSAAPPTTLLSKISAQVKRIDRKNPLAEIRRLMKVSNDQVGPQVISVPGVDEDEHRLLVLMLSQDREIQHCLRRVASAGNVIANLPWPAEQKKIDVDESFQTIMEELSKITLVNLESNGAFDLRKLRERFDKNVVPCAYWLLVRRAIAFEGHGELLRRLFEFWSSIPIGRPVWLLLCVARDEPTDKKVTPDEKLLSTIADANRKKQLTEIAALEEITADHIGGWIDELRSVCELPSPEQYDGLHLSLLNMIGGGKRLRHVAAAVGRILPTI